MNSEGITYLMRSYDFFYIPVLVSLKRSYQHHNPFIPLPLPVHPRPLFASLLYSRRYLLFLLLAPHILDVTLNKSSRVRGRMCTFGCSDSNRFFLVSE